MEFSVKKSIDATPKRPDGTLMDIVRVEDENGNMTYKRDVFFVSPHKFKITWYNYDGSIADVNSDENIRSFMWQVEFFDPSITILPVQIEKIEYPEIVYTGNNPDYKVKFTYQVLE